MPIDDQARALLILLSLLGYLYFFSVSNPYLNTNLNSFQKQSISIVILTIYFGFVGETERNDIVALIFNILFFLFNIIFYCFWIVLIWIIPFIKRNRSSLLAITTKKKKKTAFKSRLSNSI